MPISSMGGGGGECKHGEKGLPVRVFPWLGASPPGNCLIASEEWERCPHEYPKCNRELLDVRGNGLPTTIRGI